MLQLPFCQIRDKFFMEHNTLCSGYCPHMHTIIVMLFAKQPFLQFEHLFGLRFHFSDPFHSHFNIKNFVDFLLFCLYLHAGANACKIMCKLGSVRYFNDKHTYLYITFACIPNIIFH